MFTLTDHLQIACVVAAVFGVIMYRIIVVALFYASSDEIVRRNAKIATTVTAAIINLIIIMILNRVSATSAVLLLQIPGFRYHLLTEDIGSKTSFSGIPEAMFDNSCSL